MTTWNPTSSQLESHLTTCLTAAGYLEAYRFDGDISHRSTHRKAGSPIDFKITAEEVMRPGVDDLIAVTIRELDARGNETGIEHTTSHLTALNLPALLAIGRALEEHLAPAQKDRVLA